jgi:hypothetical protein
MTSEEADMHPTLSAQLARTIVEDRLAAAEADRRARIEGEATWTSRIFRRRRATRAATAAAQVSPRGA